MKRACLSILALAASLASGAHAQQVDPALPAYQAVSGVSGSLKSIGSDTLNNLMTLWGEGFKAAYPNVTLEVEGKGSSTAPPALIAGTATFGPMSRAMKEKEIDDFEKAFGYKPTAVETSIDMLAVYVHKDNPIRSLTLQQVDAIFSSTRKGGLQENVRTWGDLGLTGEWASKPIQLFGRNSVSGTYGYFKEEALCKGDYKSNVNEQPGSASVVQSISSTLNAIGYSGIGYKTSSVRAVPLSKGGEAFEANEENALAGKFPLARFFYVYVNKAPNQALSPLDAEFIKLMLSKQGQEVVMKDGYIPLPAKVAEKTLKELGL